MSEHAATVSWERTSDDFSYEAYSRDHTWVFESGVSVAASAAPGYAGDPNRVDPEEAFVAAVASCHMLTFLAIAARKRLVVDGYRDAAVGTLEKNEEGRLAVTSVTLRPVVSFRDGPPAPEVIEKIHAQAHRGCFIANSVRSEIRVEAGS
jgi:organic hydroperoxide reductase OsmC/OhrA